MTSSTVTLCRCGHAEGRHSDDEGCDRGECGCAGFRPGRVETVQPAPSPAAASRPPEPSPRQPVRPSAPLVPSGTASGPTIEQIVAAGERSEKQQTRALATRIRSNVDTLRTALQAERASVEAARRKEAQRAEEKRVKDAVREQARREVAELETKLKAARARLIGNRATASTRDSAPGEHACTRPDCARTFATGQARAMHERRAHDGFDPAAAHAAKAG